MISKFFRGIYVRRVYPWCYFLISYRLGYHFLKDLVVFSKINLKTNFFFLIYFGVIFLFKWYSILQENWFTYSIETDPEQIYLQDATVDKGQALHLYQFTATVETLVDFSVVSEATNHTGFEHGDAFYTDEQ